MCAPSTPESSNKGTVEMQPQSLPARLSRKTARNPGKFLLLSLLIATVLSFIAVVVGEFKIEVDNKGWLSRHTLIADREMQMDVIKDRWRELYEDTDGSVWEYMENNEAFGFVDITDKNDVYEEERRLLDTAFKVKDSVKKNIESKERMTNIKNNFNPERNLIEDACDNSWYSNYSYMLTENNLFAMWKSDPGNDGSPSISILDTEVMSQICKAETNTLRVLEESKLCEKCGDSNTCLPPYSLIYLLREKLEMMDQPCSSLMEAYTLMKEVFVNDLVTCTTEYINNFDASSLVPGDSSNCPLPSFNPSVVDSNFGKGGETFLRITSSYFRTSDVTTPFGDELEKDKVMFKAYPDFDKGDGIKLVGTYDTEDENLVNYKVDMLIQSDMSLAVASLTITFIAMMIHTKSPWLTFLGILQIIYGIPLSYFVYVFIARLEFFPFLNFIGVFVAAALGADDLFVAVDKFKNARIRNPTGSTEDIAAVAFPDAASAMLLTTSTTAVAFFATCICPVPPILCFAVFCGLMIVFNYVMNILLVFPGLCLYDIWLQNGSTNRCINFRWKKAPKEENIHNDVLIEDPEDEEPQKLSFIHRILSHYYGVIHRLRIFVLIACITAIGLCIYFASDLSQPTDTEVRLLPSGDPFENHYLWKSFTLYQQLFQSGATVWVVFGVKAGDTGPQNKPDILSKLLLDEKFNLSSQESQVYMKGFCDRMFETSFINIPYSGYECSINKFDTWLSDQPTNPSDIWLENCSGATSVPVPEDVFDPCIIAWSKSVTDRQVLQKDGEVKILLVETEASINFRQPIPRIKEEWNKFESFFNSENLPSGMEHTFHASRMWAWYDTNQQMYLTAIGAAGIAIAFSAFIVLISSRSFVLTLFAEICIVYVLAAATAMLVGLGWELGFLESVCFAILVGISCDFIIHFGHAYIHHKGVVSKEERTKYAVIHMGPSILAAAVTTFAASIVMLFCQVIFFTKFAMILMVTILHATLASFVIFICLNDNFGPSEPTKMIDSFIAKLRGDKTEGHKDLNDLELIPENEIEKI